MWPIDRPPQWVGRSQELATLRAGVGALRRDERAVVWVEGEPGIGRSSLVVEALAGVSELGWDIGWGFADQLTERMPLSVMQDCLQVRPGSPDPRRAHAAGLLRSQRLGLLADGDASVNGVEVLMSLAEELCAAAPTVMVIDDLQWADNASLLVWHQLAASIDQLRLLLIATCRPTPRRPEVQQVRAAVVRRGGAVITLGPLPETDVAALVTAMVGAPPGDALRRLTAQAAGNPLYVRELVDALVREQALHVGRAAEVSVAGEQLSASLAAVLSDRLSAVSAETAQMLRTAALLGAKFTVTDLAVLLRRPVSDLAGGLQEAVAAGLLVGSGSELAFRHLLIRQALYESMPAALRTALHAEAARELAATSADALSVARQLAAARQPSKGWARTWLIQTAPTLTARAPQLAADLLLRELDETPSGDEAWDGLMASLVWALLAAGSYEEAARRASRALTVMTDPVRKAETFRVLARAQVSARHTDDAITTIRRALASADLPGEWRARMLVVLAMLERAGTGNLDAADATARQALTVAEETGDTFATAHALAALWFTHGIRRDHAAALDYIDRALRVLGDDPGHHPDLRSYALEVRIFTLQNLDRWPEAELALQQTREFAQRSGSSDRATWVTAAVLRYWLGQWDDALAELNSDDTDAPGLRYTFLREDWPALQRRREGVRLTEAGSVLLEESRAVLSRVDHGVSRTRQAAGLGRPRLRFIVSPDLPEDLAVDVATRLRAAAKAAGVDVAWIEAPLDGEFSPVLRRRVDAGLGWLAAAGEDGPAALEVMSLGEFEPDVWLPPGIAGRVTGLGELAGLDVVHGPRRLSPLTYDAWLAVLREVNPHFEFTDPPFRRSLPITLALAASTSRPTAVLTGPHHRLGDWPGPAEPDPAADPADLVRARIDGSPLTAAAALVWSGDLPRLLQQVLFDTADSVVF